MANSGTLSAAPDLLAIEGAGFVTANDALHFLRDQLNLIPKTSPPVSATSGTTTGKIVGDKTTGTPDTVVVITDAVAGNFGAWVEIDASVSADSWISNITVLPYDTNALVQDRPCVIEIGTGAGGAEVAKIRLSCAFHTVSAVGVVSPAVFTVPIPIKVASGVRIAVRASTVTSASMHYRVGLSMYQVLEV